MKEPKKNIIISFPIVWSIRNFILSGITEDLNDKYIIYYATSVIGKQYFLNMGIPESRILVFETPKKGKLYSIVIRLLKETFSQRYPIPENRVFAIRSERAIPEVQNVRILIYKAVAHFFKNKLLYKSLCYAENILFLSSLSQELDKQLKRINPILAISTAFVVEWEWGLFRLIHKNQIPVWTHVLSFDNITSRGFIPINFFDKYLVWNEQMKDELKKYYEIPAEKINISGTPQFDFHLIEPKNYKQYIKKPWIEITKDRFILYCANHYDLTPKEPELLDNLLARVRMEKINVKKIILRLHPMDDYSRWNHLLTRYPELIINVPWKQPSSNAKYWGDPTLQDIYLFSHLLRSASVVLHIASTISIDAAITNTPNVCIGFHPTNKLESLKYYNYHFTNHYRPIIDTKACALATDMPSLLSYLKEATENPGSRGIARRNLAELLCNDLVTPFKEKLINLISEHNHELAN